MLCYDMATELRWESLVNNFDSGETQADAEETFRNEANDIAHVRIIRIETIAKNLNVGEEVAIEVSKAPAYQSLANTTFFTFGHKHHAHYVQAASEEVDLSKESTLMFARGQLPLEQNEALYVNWEKDSGPIGDYRVRIGYEY